jgi:pyruvate/2-oxoacid:ferredoxin oxidoreductase alpha subunit
MGFGIVSRILRSVVDRAREDGLKVGLLRPKTLWPFPKQAILDVSKTASRFLVVELNFGQMIDDVRLVLNGSHPIEFYGRQGGNVPTVEEIYEVTKSKLGAAADANA